MAAINHKTCVQLNLERENPGIIQAWQLPRPDPCSSRPFVLHEGGFDRVSSVPASDRGLNISTQSRVEALVSCCATFPKVDVETTTTSSSN